jgi:hypothetical protein
MFKAGDEPAFFYPVVNFTYLSKNLIRIFPHKLARDLWNPLESNSSEILC